MDKVVDDGKDYPSDQDQRQKLILTRTRETITPFLPPPILRAIHTVDSNPQVQSFIGNEPSMSITTTLILIYLFTLVVKYISSSNVIGGKQAVDGLQDDEPESAVTSHLSKLCFQQRDQDENAELVIMFGPCHSGKTVLFHKLLSLSSRTYESQKKGRSLPNTVTSLKAKFTTLSVQNEDENLRKTCNKVRLIDYPGHLSLSAQLSSLLYPSSRYVTNGTMSRALFVVDSTKPLSDAAMLLYNEILTNGNLLQAWEKKRVATGQVFQVMIVCSKTDMKNSKNWRRIKIQLKNELERIRKIASSSNTEHGFAINDVAGGEVFEETERVTLNLKGKTIDLDDLGSIGVPMVKFHFLSVSCVDQMKGMNELQAFVNFGKVLTDSTSILKNGRRT